MKKKITVDDTELMQGILAWAGIVGQHVKGVEWSLYKPPHPLRGQVKEIVITLASGITIDVRRDELIRGILTVLSITDAKGGYELRRRSVTSATDTETDIVIDFVYRT